VHGRATHSSLTPEGCNAVEYAAQFITWLKKYAEQLKNRLTDIHFDVPYTTLTSNIIQGGTAVNIIPNVCEVDFEFRQLPNDSAEAIQKDIQNYIDTTLIPLMKKDFENANVELIELGANPSFEAKPDETMVELLKEITNVSKIKKVSYATEAGLFQKAKISTVICGPGSIEQAHRPNEFIAIDELERYEKILLSFVKQFNKKA
jgi:acetylornithine deacetylase